MCIAARARRCTCEGLPDGFRLVGRSVRRFTGDPLLARIGQVVQAGASTVDQILEQSMDSPDSDGAAALHLLELMRDAGVLDSRLP